MAVDLVPFSELLETVVDNRGKTCPTATSGIPLIATNCIRNDTLYPAYEKVRFVSRETFESWFRGHPKPGDLIFVTKGTPGRVCMTPDPVDFCIAQDMVAIRANEKRVYPKYLFALLRSRAAQAQIENMHVGTLIPHFKKGDFDKLYLPVPDKKVQQLIGDIYFELTYKIELNLRTNETLEAIAGAIFKSWFVDFDPVRARNEDLGGSLWERDADAFPGNLVDSELGPIPNGWDVGTLYDRADYINGLTFRAEDFSQGRMGLPVIKIGELKDGITNQTKFTLKVFDPKYRIKSGDILFAWSGSPDTSIDIFIWSGLDGWLNQHIFKIEAKNPEEKVFVYFLLRFFKPVFIETARNKQTTGLGHVTARDLKRLKTSVPSKGVLRAFNRIAEPLFQRAYCCRQESANLCAIRDTLLPKLMSSEIRIRQAEKIVEARA